MITVKVVVVPGMLKEVALEDGTNTVANALEAADVNAEGRSIQINGVTASTSDAIKDGDRIMVAKSTKGNA